MVDTRFPVSVHIMTGLAYNRPGLVSSEHLAKSIKTNPSFVRKLAVALASAGLIESVRGKAGGLRLVKNPREITLDQIYRAVTSGALIAVPDKKPEKTCSISCGIGDVLCELSKDIEENMLKQLSKRNLAEIVDRLSK